MKKLILVLLVFILSGCTRTEFIEVPVIVKEEVLTYPCEITCLKEKPHFWVGESFYYSIGRITHTITIFYEDNSTDIYEFDTLAEMYIHLEYLNNKYKEKE